MYKSLLTFGAGETLIGILAQADVMPDSLIGIFAQLPLVAVIVWLWLQTDKRQREEKEKDRIWFEHMLGIQRETTKEAYESRDKLMPTLISQIEEKQNEMIKEVKMLSGQVSVNTATVNEIAKVDSLVSELIDRLERK